jgi:shikimate kinase
MKSCRIHIMGASGSGVTCLGRTLADALAIPHHDTDDYFWQPTVPPYRDIRVTPNARPFPAGASLYNLPFRIAVS